MNSVMTRSLADYMGFNWPKELHSIVNGRRVTWAEVRAARKEEQAKHLRQKMEGFVPRKRRAAYVWVFRQPGLFGFVYAGWWLYIRTMDKDWALDFRSVQWDFILKLMAQFPCGVIPLKENFEKWKFEFAKQYSRPGRFKNQGLLIGWVDFGRNGWPENFERVAASPAEKAE